MQAQVLHPDRSLAAFASGTVQVQASVLLDRVLALADQQMYEHKAATYQDRAQRQQDRHISVADFPQFLMGLNTPQAILEQGLGKAAQLAGFEAWFHAEHGETLELTYREQADHPVRRGSLPIAGWGEGIIPSAIRERATVWAADYERSPYAQLAWVTAGLKSVVVTPVLVGSQVNGVVAFSSYQTWRSVTPQARQLLQTVASHLGHRLEQDAVTARLAASLEAGITGTGVLMEARDLETAGHTLRVVALARQLGMAAGLEAEQLQALRLGAYLHDVGKLSIPDRVLLKPGALDAEEWALMQTHSEAGARMVAQLPSLPPEAIQVVRSHHERWDGHGYPDGLSGEEVPLLARIFAVCDVYDALVNVRPYKLAWTIEEARTELQAQRGRHLDPQLTALFLDQVAGDRACDDPMPLT